MSAKIQYFDSTTLAAVVHELADLGEARIDKVGQPSWYELYLNLRAGGKNHRLYLNIREQWARLHLTERPFANMPVPSPFTMLLRKHLEGSRLLRVEQDGLERMARLVVAGRDELGDPFERTLVVELIGKYSNMFLVEGGDQTILGCARVVTEAMCQARQLGPGLPYDPPPVNAGKVDFREAREADFLAALEGGGRVADRLVEKVSGLSKLAASQILAAGGFAPAVAVDELDGLEPLLALLRRAQEDLSACRFHPRLEAGPGWRYSIWWLAPGEPPADASVSRVLDRYYGELESRLGLDDKRRLLRGELGALLKKQRGRIRDWERSLAESENADRHRELGDLLSAHMHLLSPGMSEVRVTDFFHPDAPEVGLPLDPQLTPSENVQRHFRRYQKARNAVQAVQGLLVTGREELSYLEQIGVAIEQATTMRDLQEVDQELALLLGKPVNQPPRGQPRRGKQQEPEPEPLLITSSDGIAIYVGKNNKQNEYVTFKLARSNDLWLHTQNIPGSHVVVRADGEVPERTLHEAAAIAAHFSQARDSSQVPVVVTRKKHVKKPKGAKPGMVIYEQEETLFVNPGMDLGFELPGVAELSL